MYRAHRAVIFAIAQLSCITLHSVDNTGSDSEEDTPAVIQATSPIPSTSSVTSKQQRTAKEHTGATRYILVHVLYLL